MLTEQLTGTVLLPSQGLLTLTLCLWSCISLAPRASYAQRQIYSQKR